MAGSHASSIDALNQSLADSADDIRVSFEFFPPQTEEAEKNLGNQSNA